MTCNRSVQTVRVASYNYDLQPFLALELADHGAVFREATADPDGTTLVIDIPDTIEVRTITRLVREMFTDIELRSKQTLDQAMDRDLYSAFLETHRSTTRSDPDGVLQWVLRIATREYRRGCCGDAWYLSTCVL